MRLVEILANLNISIHVPSWGTTVPTRVSTRGPSLFQSTFPRGERLYLTTRNMRAAIFQSTFPRGERLRAYEYLYPPINFNPRSLVGNDEVSLSRTRSKPIFQSTFPRGERPVLHCDLQHQCYFNPRSLVGNDCKFSQIFFVFLCNKYNFSTFYYPFSLFFSVIHVTFLIFVVRILPAFYVYF